MLVFAEGWVWGIDVALSRLAVACASLATSDVAVVTVPITVGDATEGERLGLFDRQVRCNARTLAELFPPTVVWVEQPSGRHRALQLAYASGVVQAALFEVLGGVPVWSIPSSAWKRRALGDGHGNATKAQVRAWVDEVGIDVNDQDEADAAGIAIAGRLMVESGRWEAAA